MHRRASLHAFTIFYVNFASTNYRLFESINKALSQNDRVRFSVCLGIWTNSENMGLVVAGTRLIASHVNPWKTMRNKKFMFFGLGTHCLASTGAPFKVLRVVHQLITHTCSTVSTACWLRPPYHCWPFRGIIATSPNMELWHPQVTSVFGMVSGHWQFDQYPCSNGQQLMTTVRIKNFNQFGIHHPRYVSSPGQGLSISAFPWWFLWIRVVIIHALSCSVALKWLFYVRWTCQIWQIWQIWRINHHMVHGCRLIRVN